MFAIIRSELAYRKWDYLAYTFCGALVSTLLIYKAYKDPRFQVELSEFVSGAILFGVFVAMFFGTVILPQTAYKTFIKENRLQQLAITPLATWKIPLTLTLPYLIFMGSLILVGTAALTMGYVFASPEKGIPQDHTALAVLACINLWLGLVAVGMASFVANELGNVVPKWVRSVTAVVLVVGAAVWQVVNQGLSDLMLQIFTKPYLPVKGFIAVGIAIACYFLHRILFTHFRKDLSNVSVAA